MTAGAPMLGQTLGGWLLVDVLGEGGMGTVYLGRSLAGEEAAVKVLHAHLADGGEAWRRFRREAEIGRQLRDPRIVRLREIGESLVDGVRVPYLVMDRVTGRSLRDLLDRMGPLPEPLVRHIAREMAAALVIMHASGVVHRDLKPENVILTEAHQLTLLDLGIARLMDETLAVSFMGQVVGSLAYAAPEQLAGQEGVNPRFDLYALGVVLYELATGENPFVGDTLASTLERQQHLDPPPPSAHNPAITPFFDDVVLSLLRKDPRHRLDSAAMLLAMMAEGEHSVWAHGRERHAPPRRMGGRSRHRMHGREVAVARMEAAVDRAEETGAGIVHLHGPSGVGVTRLLDEALGRLADGTRSCHAGVCRPGDSASEVLGRALGQPAVGAGAPANLLAQRAAERPLVVALDDGDALPPAERQRLAEAVAACGQAPVLLLFGETHAPDAVPEPLAGPATTRIPVEGLPAAPLEALLFDLLRHRESAEALVEAVGEATGGMPVHAIALVRHLRAARLLLRGRLGRLECADAETPAKVRDLPDTVEALWAARLAELAPAARRLLIRLALSGLHIDADAFALRVDAPPLALLLPLAHLEVHEDLVHSHGAVHRFASRRLHQMLCDSAAAEGVQVD